MIDVVDVSISTMSLPHKPERGDAHFWKQFNASFRNHQIAPLEFADRVWHGHAFTAWLKEPWRHVRNYDHAQVLALDFDSGDKRSDPDNIYKDPFVKRYGSFIYTTYSHTPEAPRCRIVFVLDTPIYQPHNFSRSAAALIWLFGGYADRASKDAVRGFFGGPPGETDAYWIGETLPLELVKQIIRQYEKTGMIERHRRGRRPFRASTTSEQEIVDALAHIDPWAIDYDEWVKILMAIHSAMPEERGLQLAERWGQGEKNEIQMKWRSFDPARGVTVATLFNIAKRFGYTPQKSKRI